MTRTINIRGIDEGEYRRIKIAVATEGKTLREWCLVRLREAMNAPLKPAVSGTQGVPPTPPDEVRVPETLEEVRRYEEAHPEVFERHMGVVPAMPKGSKLPHHPGCKCATCKAAREGK